MADPLVSFVVPCYKLAHLLPECIDSILAQTYTNFEILIMDDASPDSTPEVANSFHDVRVKHIRNHSNLGHLRNYNQGITLSQGKYVWLISADDRLRRSYVLERYVRLMEANPEVGYVFCPGMALEGGVETCVLPFSVHGDQDAVFKGRDFFVRLLEQNSVVAAAGMVRKECYEKVTIFPLDMPYAGDWYLWAVFALHYDVGYFAEPMVDYRQHELSMTEKLLQEDVTVCVRDSIGLYWRFYRKAQETGETLLIDKCRHALADEYGQQLVAKQYRGRSHRMTSSELDDSLHSFAKPEEFSEIFLRVLAAAGDHAYWNKELPLALDFYRRALYRPFRAPGILAKYVLLRAGSFGVWVREVLFILRRAGGQTKSALSGRFFLKARTKNRSAAASVPDS